MVKKIDDYAVGYDIGTDSIGWAAIDSNYNLLRLNGKDAWGSYLFTHADPASSRRKMRAQRRRYSRRKERIMLLQELLAPMVLADDPEFFNRLRVSNYFEGDGSYFRSNHYNIFDGGEYSDKDYYKQYPTIYHLRYALATGKEKADPRLIYLALHHIIKYRGNFLYEGRENLTAGLLSEEIENFCENINEDFGYDMHYDGKIEKIVCIAKDKTKKKADKKEEIKKLFVDIANQKYVVAFTNAILGYKFSLQDLINFGNTSEDEKILDDQGKELKISFADSEYDECEDKYLEECGEKESILLGIKAVYMALLFEDVMGGQKSISEAMIAKYDKHKADLKILKQLCHENLTKEEYISFFRRSKNRVVKDNKDVYKELRAQLEKLPQSEEKSSVINRLDNGTFLPEYRYKNEEGEIIVDKSLLNQYDEDIFYIKRVIAQVTTGKDKQALTNKFFETVASSKKTPWANYVNYVASVNKVGKKLEHYDVYRPSQEQFCNQVRDMLKAMPESEEQKMCLRDIELGNFLPKINSVENGAIPYQFHKYELEAIIQNQGRYYPELLQMYEGDNNEKVLKIVSILDFKRPYYVGTLKGDWTWCEQIIKERVTPWNFYDLVDTDALAEKFITRMTSNCRIFGEQEKALPLNSILYQAYITLNEINKIKFKNNTISTECKKNIFNNLCLKKNQVKVKDIEALLQNSYNQQITEGDISGLSDTEKLTGTMSTFRYFEQIFGRDFVLKNISKCEKAIEILTIFDDLKIRKKRLKEIGCFTDEQIGKLSKKKFKKWGAYSAKLLDGILDNRGNTILQEMYDTDKHFNELINDTELGFMEKFPNTNQVIEKFNYNNDIKDLYCSPSVKKAIWNVLKISEEIEKIAKNPPAMIFLESTCGEEDKKKTTSRLSRIQSLYKSINNKDEDGNSEYFNADCVEELANLDKNGKKLDSDKLYLWFAQLGRCMYTDEIIPLDELSKCEIDHIVPRAYIKDDSLENRVLVKSIENQRKSDSLAIRQDVQERMRGFWKFLLEKGFIGSKKYKNLNRTDYSDQDKIGFINRQLVETSQTVKLVKQLLQKRYPNAEIRCIKAGMNKEFRHKYAPTDILRNGDYSNACKDDYKAGFYKIRNLNDFHHAKDAYLTAVLGQFTTVACPMWGQDEQNKYLKYYIKNNDLSKYSVRSLVNSRYGIVLDLMQYGSEDNFQMKDGEYLWDNTRYCNVLDTMAKNTCHVVKEKLRLAKTSFYNQTIQPAGDSDKLIPLKKKGGIDMPCDRYGGYTNENAAYFVVVEVDDSKKNSNKRKCVIKNIPLYVAYAQKQNSNAINEYLEKELGKHPKFMCNIYKQQLVRTQGQLCYITSDNELNNAQEVYVDKKYERMLWLIDKEMSGVVIINNSEKFVSSFMPLIKEFIADYVKIINQYLPYYNGIADNLSKALAENQIENMQYNFKKNVVEENATDENLAKLTKEHCNDVINMLCQMLTIVSCGACRVDKFVVGGGGSRLAKTINPEKVEWIDRSYTGLYETVKVGNKKWPGDK